MYCPRCKKYETEGDFCQNCGARLDAKCPGCGIYAPEGSYCGRCGTRLNERKEITFVKKKSPEQKYYEYYEKYQPDRTKAIMALREDTGMDLEDAVREINLLFDSCEGKNSDKAVPSTQRKCPSCSSTNVVIRERQIIMPMGFGYGRHSIIRLFYSMMRFAVTVLNLCDTVTVRHVCNDCGHRW